MKDLQQLLAAGGQIWRGSEYTADDSSIATCGYPALERQLPGGGWPTGIIRIYYPAHGIGELRLFLPLLAAVTQEQRHAVFVQPPCMPYAPALQQMDLKFLHVIDHVQPGDACWAADKLLRNAACAVVLLWCGPGATLRPARLRRLQLAARQGRSHLLLFHTGITRRDDGGWESMVLRLQPDEGKLQIHVHKARGLCRPVQIGLSFDA